MRQRRLWTEQYLLQTFLAVNREFEVLWAASHLHLRFPERLRAAYPSYSQGGAWPGSFWMRRRAY